MLEHRAAGAPASGAFDVLSEARQKIVVVPRLFDVIASAAAHRLDGGGDARPGRHDQHRERGLLAAHAGEEIEPLQPRRGVARVVQIEQGDVELFFLDGSENGSGRRSEHTIDPFRPKEQAETA